MESDEKDTLPKERKGPWIRYRVEHRLRYSDEVLAQRETNDFETAVPFEVARVEQPAFEVVTTFRINGLEKTDDESRIPPSALPPPSYHMKIYSSAIINAVQSVVKYYPSQDLTGDALQVKWPYAILVHHYDELTAFRDERVNKDKEELCIREWDAADHLELLLKFLDDHIMSEVRAEMERNSRGLYTFEYAWVLFKPGTTILSMLKGQEDLYARIVHSVSGGVFNNPPTPWYIQFWSLAYDGTYLGRVESGMDLSKFDGEASTKLDSRVIPMEDLDDENTGNLDEAATRQLEYGKKYYELLRKQCKYHKGKSGEFPYNEVGTR